MKFPKMKIDHQIKHQNQTNHKKRKKILEEMI